MCVYISPDSSVFACVCVLPILSSSQLMNVCVNEGKSKDVRVCGYVGVWGGRVGGVEGYYAPWMLPRALNSCLQAQVVCAGF